MSVRSIKATRMELTRLKQKLITAMRGHKLLKDKRDELIRQFMDLVRKNHKLRIEVEASIKQSAQSFALARSLMDEQVLETSLLFDGPKLSVSLKKQNIMGLNVPKYELEREPISYSDKYPYGLVYTTSDLDDAVENISSIIPSMIALGEIEKTCCMLSYEIERTRRRVNALEHVVIPETRQQIRFIKMKLDENERSSQVRTMKVKDMILAKAHGYGKWPG